MPVLTPVPARRPALARLATTNGFSMIELLVSVTLMVIVSGTVLGGVFRLQKTGQTVANRSEMHAGVRNATELLQQEVGQAGRVALPNRVQFATAVATSGSATVTVKAVDAAGATISTANGTDSMFVGERLVVGTGAGEETVTVTAVNTTNKQFTAAFMAPHAVNEPVSVRGGFAYGVIPSTITNGSTGSVLKIMGDINDDGQLEYLEYTCDTSGGNLYRRSVYITATTKPAKTASNALLNNLLPNPDGSSCFTYGQRSVSNVPYVVDVAITLTVQTPIKDPVTGLFQHETKALLNVAPRNVFNVWQLAGLGVRNRVQPDSTVVSSLLPANVASLMAQP